MVDYIVYMRTVCFISIVNNAALQPVFLSNSHRIIFIDNDVSCPPECCITWLGRGGGLQGEPKFGYDLHEVGAKAYNNTSPFQKIRRDKNNQ